MGKRLTVFDVFTIACLTRMIFIPVSSGADIVWKVLAGVCIIGWGIWDMTRK